MSPESSVKENVKEKLTVTIAPPPAALAADKKKAPKKRSEAENLIDGHAAGIKTDKPEQEQNRTIARQGRIGGLIGFVLFTGIAALAIVARGGYLRGATFEQAYQAIHGIPWLFGLSTRVWQFRIFATLAPVFLFCAVVIPLQFGRFWLGLGAAIGSVVTPIVLTGLFYVILTPYALFMRIFGNDPLRRSKQDGSYWIPRDKPRAHDHFEHKF